MAIRCPSSLVSRPEEPRSCWQGPASCDTIRRIETHLRASDTLIALGPRDLALLLPAASDEQVPMILGRIGQGGTVSTFCYGLAACRYGDAGWEESEPDSFLQR